MNPIRRWFVPCDKCRDGGRLCDKHFVNAVRVLSGLDSMGHDRVLADVVCSACEGYGHYSSNKNCPAWRGVEA